MQDNAGTTSVIHASCVAIGNAAVLIVGASGSGKSSLALQLMALGAELIADDQTEITRRGENLQARCPARIQGTIEARGVGLLTVPFRQSAVARLVIDLDLIETKRLPEPKTTVILGCQLPVYHRAEGVHFAPAILLFLKGAKLFDG